MPKSRLVPITREFLAAHYAHLPIDALPAALCALEERAAAAVRALLQRGALPAATAAEADAALSAASPKKIDENMYRVREQCEAATAVLRGADALGAHADDAAAVGAALSESARQVEAFQNDRREEVLALVRKFLPNDFRSALIERMQKRGERKSAEAIAKLRARGASVHEVYDALWDQQMERRRTLVSLGNASGLFKALVKLVAGIPAVLLDFVRQINDDRGPMEEMRLRYGPYVYGLTRVGHVARALALASVRVVDPDAAAELFALLRELATQYAAAVTYYLTFMRRVWAESPFFLEDYQVGGTLTAEPATELVVARGATERVPVFAEAGHSLSWEFESSKDITFAVLHGERVLARHERVEAHKTKFVGSVACDATGGYHLEFDNTHSYFTKKTVFYRVLVVAARIDDDDDDVVSSAAASSDAAPVADAAAHAAASSNEAQ